MDETPETPRPDEDQRRPDQHEPTTGDRPDGPVRPPDERGDRDRRRTPSRRRVAAAIVGLAVLLGGAGLALVTGGDEGGEGGEGRSEATEPAPGPAEPTPEEAAFEFSRCMRDHGIEGYPDPTVEE